MKPIQAIAFTAESGCTYHLRMDHHGVWWMHTYRDIGDNEKVLIDLFSLGFVADRAEREFLGLAYAAENRAE